jgi:D-inositol-3-phosphate glycosyltransferase
MRRLPVLRALSTVFKVMMQMAADVIRRHGLMFLLRRALSIRRWRALLLPRRTTFNPIAPAGAIDGPHDGLISRDTGEVYGWALLPSDTIDRVEIIVDGRSAGAARLGVPRTDILSDLPEAGICGFQINLDPEHLPTYRDTVDVGFVVHAMSAVSHAFRPRTMRLAPAAQVAADTVAPKPTGPNVDGRPGRTRPSGGKLRLACFTHDLGYGGGQLYLQELLRQFAAGAAADGVVYSPKDGPLRHELTSLGFRVEILQEPSLTDADAYERATDTIAERLRNEPFDCVLANTLAGFPAINAAAKARLPSVWSVHESFRLPMWSALYTRQRPGSEFVLSKIVAALGQSSSVIFESEATRRMFLPYGAEDRFVKISYGVATSTIDRFLAGFDRQRARRERGIASGSRVLLCMGTVEQRKQQIFLAQAFAEAKTRHDDVHLLLVGDSPSFYSIALRRYLHRKDIERSVSLVPIVADPYPWYAVADCFVLLSAIESMPRSIIEAMGFGLQVLATRIFGVSELIDDGKTGFLIEPNSLRSAAEGLDRLLGLSAAEQKSLSRAAMEKIRRDHDSSAYAAAYLSLIRRLAG